MKRNPFGIETKTGAATGAAFLVSTVFAALHYWWHVQVPPVYLTGAITTVVTFAAGYLARHTPRPGTLTGDLTAEFYTKPPAVTQLPAAPKGTTP